MIVEFDKSFSRWLSKIEDSEVLKKIEQAILQAEEKQLAISKFSHDLKR